MVLVGLGVSAVVVDVMKGGPIAVPGREMSRHFSHVVSTTVEQSFAEFLREKALPGKLRNYDHEIVVVISSDALCHFPRRLKVIYSVEVSMLGPNSTVFIIESRYRVRVVEPTLD